MKHIFTIHSHITFLLAYSTIRHLELDKKDVILLSSGYNVRVGEFRVETAYQKKFKGFWEKVREFNAPKSHDRYIDSLTGGEPFEAYIDLMSYYQKILVTHPKCKAFHFIEEGNGAYQAYDDMTDVTWPERHYGYRNRGLFDGNMFKALIRVLRGYNLRLLSIPYNYMAFVNFKDIRFYCFSGNSYFNAPAQKKVILKPEPNEELLSMAYGVSLKNEVIWIDGSNGRYTGLPESYYHRAIDKALEILKGNGLLNERVYVKLRPGEDAGKNYLCAAIQKQGFKVELIPASTVLEALFIVSENCIVIGNLSAALEYAYCFGHEVYSIYSLFEKRVPTFFDRMDGFWEHTKLLKEN
jgi:hypothetical protein